MFDRSTYFRFVPLNGLSANTLYTMTIASSLRSSQGENLTAPFTASFHTAEFQITSSDPGNGYTNISPYATMNFYTNGILDRSTLEAAFSISPTVPGALLMTGSAATSFMFRPDQPLGTGVTYTVTVTSALHT